MREENFNRNSPLYRVKKVLDRLLPLMLLMVSIYLYLDIFASTQNLFYNYKIHLQYMILFYFLADLIVLFTMYEENKKFFRNHWFDIILTIPFLTAFKGLRGLKIIKIGKSSKLIKPGKALKSVKISQKVGKLFKKTRKLFRKIS